MIYAYISIKLCFIGLDGVIRDTMPSTYKTKPGVKSRLKHSEVDFVKATAAIMNGMTYRKAAEKFKIPRSVVCRHFKSPTTRNSDGWPTVLDNDIEALLVQKLILCGSWGYPLTVLDLKLVVKGYLDRRGEVEPRFKENLPGDEWTRSFLKRHHGSLSQRICQNIKRNRAAVSHATINAFFDELNLPSTASRLRTL